MNMSTVRRNAPTVLRRCAQTALATAAMLVAGAAHAWERSEERRVGKECA